MTDAHPKCLLMRWHLSRFSSCNSIAVQRSWNKKSAQGLPADIRQCFETVQCPLLFCRMCCCSGWCIFSIFIYIWKKSPLDGPIQRHLEILQSEHLRASFQGSLAFHFRLKNVYGFLDVSWWLSCSFWIPETVLSEKALLLSQTRQEPCFSGIIA